MRGLIPKDEYISVIADTTGALKDEALRNRFIALGFEYISLRVERDRATPPRAEVDVEDVVREVADAMSRYSASIVQTAYVSDAVRRALARATGGV